MVFRKWFYIFIAAWFINALVCFNATDGFIDACCKTAPQNSGETLFDVSPLKLSDHAVKDNVEHEDRKGSYRNRYLNPRLLDYDIQPLSSQTFGRLAFLNRSALIISAYGEKLFTPPLHHFLFRLSPF
ncbi:hypothetical protein [Mucilaginibacter sp. AK015]|uniref:hypothetical protein n=1 Tax=Mucilaginibacter sp. AK015 TaxID=2723072 RepID=UPI0016109202|nr:hypothetical protein [Mucilaginibacter sp. AK015]MBB5395692.1 hypothetical protein [Mucilaginibacter sp. AK015]